MLDANPDRSSEAWRTAERISDEIRSAARHERFGGSWRLGGAVLQLESNEPSLLERFDEVYSDCATTDPPALRCTVDAHPDGSHLLLRFDPPQQQLAPFVAFIFPERNFVAREEAGGWTAIDRDGASVALIHDDGDVVVIRRDGWQSFAGNVAVNALLRAQRELLFFHAATLDVDGRGILVSGPKMAGKTTLALALAARGHALLGDEVAAVRRDDWSLLPFRRALSIREGTRPRDLDRALTAAGGATEIFPDGQPRTRIAPSRLFATPVPAASPLRAAFFLRAFASTTSIERMDGSASSLRLLQPLGCTLWDNRSSNSIFDLFRFFQKTRCYWLDAGPPDEAAARVEEFLREAS